MKLVTFWELCRYMAIINVIEIRRFIRFLVVYAVCCIVLTFAGLFIINWIVEYEFYIKITSGKTSVKIEIFWALVVSKKDEFMSNIIQKWFTGINTRINYMYYDMIWFLLNKYILRLHLVELTLLPRQST